MPGTAINILLGDITITSFQRWSHQVLEMFSFDPRSHRSPMAELGFEPRQPVSWAPALIQSSSLNILSWATSGYQRALPPAEVLGLLLTFQLRREACQRPSRGAPCREDPWNAGARDKGTTESSQVRTPQGARYEQTSLRLNYPRLMPISNNPFLLKSSKHFT